MGYLGSSVAERRAADFYVGAAHTPTLKATAACSPPFSPARGIGLLRTRRESVPHIVVRPGHAEIIEPIDGSGPAARLAAMATHAYRGVSPRGHPGPALIVIRCSAILQTILEVSLRMRSDDIGRFRQYDTLGPPRLTGTC